MGQSDTEKIEKLREMMDGLHKGILTWDENIGKDGARDQVALLISTRTLLISSFTVMAYLVAILEREATG